MENRKRGAFYWDRPLLSIIRFPFYYFFAMPILFIFNSLFFGLKIEGREYLRGLKKGVFLCNHIHYLDCTMLDLAVFPRQIIFASQKSNFRLPLAGLILRIAGCLPVGDNLHEIRKYTRVAIHKAHHGVWLGIYPEGNLCLYNHTLQPFKKGAFFIAYQAQVPIIPVVIIPRPPKEWLRRIRKRPFFTLKIIPPLTIRAELEQKDAIEELRSQAFLNMAAYLSEQET